jgi:rhodanese-related sulfurtransferase
MPQLNAISSDKLLRLIGTANAPALVDVRDDAVFASDPHLLPGAVRRDPAAIASWASALAGRAAVVLCEAGGARSAGVAALLRNEGCDAEILEGGHAAWRGAGLPLVPEALLPKRDSLGRTVWVTRARPKVDRIACPWLIRRFVDPDAVFLFVNPADVLAVADDLAQLDAGMLLYDAFYRWSRDARGETHDWTSHRPREPRA